jgi:hypothetical protein
MDSTTIEISKLQRVSKRLRFVGKINLGLMLVLLVCAIWTWFQTVALGRMDLGKQDLTPAIHQVRGLLSFMMPLCLICLGLLLAWGPALIFCSSKIKRLSKKKDADA